MRSAADGRQALIKALRDEGGLVAVALNGSPGADVHGGGGSGPAQQAVAGPRAARAAAQYELLLEMIYEGSRLHYRRPRVFSSEDPDLSLLLGDRLYAAGLARLAELGDLEAVAELADVISLMAQAEAREDSELADAVWTAGAQAIGWGGSPEHEAAKLMARQERPGAMEALQSQAGPVGR